MERAAYFSLKQPRVADRRSVEKQKPDQLQIPDFIIELKRLSFQVVILFLCCTDRVYEKTNI